MVDGGEWWLILDYAQIILWGYVLSYQYQVLKKKTRMVPHQLSAEQHLETFLTLEELRVVSILYIYLYIYIQRQLLPEFIEEPEKCCAKKECSRLSTGILYTNNHPADFLTQWNFTTSRSK